jgi:hypothetical protein
MVGSSRRFREEHPGMIKIGEGHKSEVSMDGY